MRCPSFPEGAPTVDPPFRHVRDLVLAQRDVRVYSGKNYSGSLGTLARGEKGSSVDGDTLKILSNKRVNCR